MKAFVTLSSLSLRLVYTFWTAVGSNQLDYRLYCHYQFPLNKQTVTMFFPRLARICERVHYKSRFSCRLWKCIFLCLCCGRCFRVDIGVGHSQIEKKNNISRSHQDFSADRYVCRVLSRMLAVILQDYGRTVQRRDAWQGSKGIRIVQSGGLKSKHVWASPKCGDAVSLPILLPWAASLHPVSKQIWKWCSWVNFKKYQCSLNPQKVKLLIYWTVQML